jgi:hypothetical protein
MPVLTEQQWGEVRRAYLGRSETLQAIADRFDTSPDALRRRAKREGWPSRRPPPRSPAKGALSAATISIRQRLVTRLFRIIETELELMEQCVRKQVEDPEANSRQPAADRERDARAVATLVRSLDKVTEIAADLDRASGGKPKSADADDLFAEADRFRRELAERLSKFIPASG